MTSKTIFLPSNFFSHHAGIEPPSAMLFGSIKLGSLIFHIEDPRRSIGWGSPLDMTNYNMSVKTLDGGSTDHSDKSSLTFSQKLLVEAIELLGAKLNIDTKNSHKVVAAMDEIKMETIDPSKKYVKASVQQSRVQSWLKAQRPGNLEHIFMICGMLIAIPAASSQIDISRSSSSYPSADIQADREASQSPVGSSTGAATGFYDEFGLGFVPKRPFVFGFTVRECSYAKHVGSSKPYTEGAEMHDSSAAAQNESVKHQESEPESSVPKVNLEFSRDSEK